MASIHYNEGGGGAFRRHAARESQFHDEAPAAFRGPGAAPDGAPELRGRSGLQRWINLAGAATSLALVLGVCVWGYKLAMRDMNGVPVIRATVGPARIAPEDPGGELARHVGLAVNEVAGSGGTAPAAERVTLAPEAAKLSDEDKAMGDMPALSQSAEPLAETGTERIAAGAAPVISAEQADMSHEGEIDDPAISAQAEDSEIEDPAPALPPGAIALSVPGVTHSPRPLSRPNRDLVAEAVAASLGGQVDAAPAAAAASSGRGAVASGGVEVDAASLSAGTRLVQLGAFDTADQARRAWDKVAQRFGPLMEGKHRVVQEASSGGRSFWRLRVEGFPTLDDSRRFCAALLAEGQTCIPASVR